MRSCGRVNGTASVASKGTHPDHGRVAKELWKGEGKQEERNRESLSKTFLFFLEKQKGRVVIAAHSAPRPYPQGKKQTGRKKREKRKMHSK